MIPPEAPQADQKGHAGETPPAVSLRVVETLRKRADFLAANRGRKQASKGFILQARNRQDGQSAIRVGFTCSKKLGNAVARNRAKRRLREIARLVLNKQGQTGWDYVLIGRREVTATRQFDKMVTDLEAALARIHS